MIRDSNTLIGIWTLHRERYNREPKGDTIVIDKNFPIRGDAFFTIFKNSPKFD